MFGGVLNPIGPGEDLVRLHDQAVDDLVKLGAVTPDQAAKNK